MRELIPAYMDDTYLLNVPKGARRPAAGESWKAYLFLRTKSGRRFVKTIYGETRREMEAEIMWLVRHNKIKVDRPAKVAQ